MTESKPVGQKTRAAASPPRSSHPTCRIHQARRLLGGTMMSLAVWALVGFAVVATANEIGRDAPITSQADSHGGEDDHAGGGHVDPFSLVLIELALVVVVAMIGRWLAGLVAQPAVLGELLIGVLVGNVGYWLGRPFFVMVMHLGDAGLLFRAVWENGVSVSQAAQQIFTEAQMAEGGVGAQLVTIMTGASGVQNILMGTSIWMFSSLGVILLLFMVGLESSVSEMVRVGGRAAAVAVVGIVAPLGMGYLCSKWLLPELSTPAHLFLGATFCATSVGITARVFKDLGALQRSEAKIILGAAVIDDVLGLIILAVIVGIVATGEVIPSEIIRISLMSAIFLGAIMLLGERFARGAARVMGILDRSHNKLLFPLALAFALSWVANMIELATIVGAFAAGLILNDDQFDYMEKESTIEELVAPLERIFAPVFFVLMGMQVNVASFLDTNTITLAIVFTVVAIVGKLVAGLPAGPGIRRIAVGIGMVPRGEVGLIFASIGRGLNVVDDAVFSALVVMIMATTLVTPPALKWALPRQVDRE